jgi:hypothetical protein
MKNLIILFLTIIAINVVHAQSVVNVNDIKLYKKSNPGEGIALGAAKETVTAYLGSPSKVSNVYSEVDDMNIEILEYAGGTKLSFINGIFDTYEINNFRASTITVGKPNNLITKPEDIARVYSTISLKRIGWGKDNNPGYVEKLARVALIKSAEGITTDSNIYIIYHIMDGSAAMNSGADPNTLVQSSIKSISIINN